MAQRVRTRTTTPSGVVAVTLVALGIGAMAVVAAAPGSPYQPILTPNGQPKGWLKDLAVRLGLGSIHGDPQLFIATAMSVVAVGAFLLLLREAFRGGVSVRAVATLVIGAHVLLLFVPLLFSRDVYSYAFYGRIAGIYGGNPYVQTPLDHSGDLLWRYVGPKWVDTPAVYGPGWTSLSALLAKVLPHPVDHVEAYRFIAIAASLATCAAIVWTVRIAWPARTAFALAAFGANPVVLFHSVASGHNDLLIALSIVLALGLVLRGRALWAIVALTLGALVKATALLPLLLLIVWFVGTRPPEERRRALAYALGIPVAIGFVFALPYLQLHDPTLGMLQLAGHEGWLSPSAGLSNLVDFLTFHTMGWAVRVTFAVVLLVAMVALAREVWRRAEGMSPNALAASWAWALVLFTLLGPVLLPWYVVWALPLVWVLPRVPRTALLGAGALLAVTLWSAEPLRYPGAFGLDLFVGRWIVTPALLLLLVLTLRDLRSRIDNGFALEDEQAPVAVVAIPEAAEHQERVATAAAEG
ncbi:MAG: glycosyltransferase 87 family protein [Actinomycetota bacterium]